MDPLEKALPERDSASSKRRRIEDRLKSGPGPAKKKAKVGGKPSAVPVPSEEKASTKDSVRSKVQKLFEDLVSGFAAASASSMAKQLEEELFASCADSATYRTRSRELLANLKGNPVVAGRLASGSLSVSALLAMSSEELATAATKQEREDIKKSNLLEAIAAGPMLAETDGEHPCPSCGSKETRAGVLSQRRQIGKSEIWGSSDAPSSVLQLACDACQHAWTRADP